jgi:hypothetical protein
MSVDDRVVAQLMPKRFTVAELKTGAHRLLADMPGAPGTVVPLDIKVTLDTIQLFETGTSMGLMRATTRLDPAADTPTVRTALARMLLVEVED